MNTSKRNDLFNTQAEKQFMQTKAHIAWWG